MNLMRLHVLAGCRALLIPNALRATQVLDLLGEPNLEIATAFWLSPRCGRFYHDFLLEAENDDRISVFAQSLRENFGSRFEPLVVLPDLIAETTGAIPPEHGSRGTLDVLLELCKAPPAVIVLHALVLPEGLDTDGSWAGPDELLAPQACGRLDGLRATLAAFGLNPDRIEIRVTTVPCTAPAFMQLFRNALSRQIATRVRVGLAKEGLGADVTRLEATIAQMLLGWGEAGIVPADALGADTLIALSERVSANLFANTRAVVDA
jgi:hypothetical protein